LRIPLNKRRRPEKSRRNLWIRTKKRTSLKERTMKDRTGARCTTADQGEGGGRGQVVKEKKRKKKNEMKRNAKASSRANSSATISC